MSVTVYKKTALIGGTGAALDSVDGDLLLDGDLAFVNVSNVFYIYILDDDLGGAESSPTVIAPDVNPGNKRWKLQEVYQSSVEQNMVAFFAAASCPAGWSEYTGLRGKYAVGLVASGTLEGGAGTALTNQENRATGAHTHDPKSGATAFVDHVGGGTGTDRLGTGSQDYRQSTESGGVTGSAVAGTPAPYVQLLACKKT